MGMRFYLILPVYVLIFFHSSAVVDCSKHDFLGVNVLGLKAGINSNLFSKDGPLAKAVDNLKTLKQNSDNFWNNVGENTANILNKVGSALTGSSNSGSSATGSVSVDGNNQGLLSENEEQGSRNEGTTNVKVSLTRKSTGSWNGDSSSSGGFSNSGSSSSSGRGSGSASFTLPGDNFNGNSQNIETADSTNQYLNNDSGNVDNDQSGRINLPTIVINGGATGSHKSSGGSYTWTWTGGSGSRPSVSSSHGSTGWSLSGRSRSNSGVSSREDSSSNIPRRSLRGRSESSPTGLSSSGSWHLRKVYHGSSSADVSPSLHLEESSGSGYGELKPNIRTSEWSVDDSGNSVGSSNQQSSQNSGSSETTKWSFRGQNSGENNEQMSNDESKEESISSSENAGGDSSASPSGNLVGVNVLGLKAGFCTNLFDKNGPLAKTGENMKNILEGKKLTNLDDLNNILGVNIGDMKADLTTNVFGKGKASNAKGQQEILGKSIFGFHEGLNTNIFSGNGPIAKVGNDLKNLLEGKLSIGDLISGKGSAASSNKNLVGVNALGVKLALCTNLFDKDGPLAKAGADVSSFFKNLGESNAKLWSNIKNALGGGSA